MAIYSPELAAKAKKAAAATAVKFIQEGMHVGLGTGSTAAYFIDALIDRCRQGLQIRAVATSEKSYDQAIKGGIPMLDVEAITTLDITIDGADEIDKKKRMIKGGGGALLREKIIATISKEMMVIIDEGKMVSSLGSFPLPVEIARFAHKATINILNEKGYFGKLRMADESPYITDCGHYIYDVSFSGALENPEDQEAIIRAIPGVMTTGFFFNLAGRVVIGNYEGSVKIIS